MRSGRAAAASAQGGELASVLSVNDFDANLPLYTFRDFP